MKKIDVLLKLVDKSVNFIIGIVLIVMLLFGIYSLYDTATVYSSAKLSDKIIKYEPKDNDTDFSLDELKKLNEDICAWIKIDNTNVNYPIVKGKDNSEYLNKNYEQEYSVAGSIFLDYRNSSDFEDLYSIIYGHNMKGNLMFSDIKAFKSNDFFEKHRVGYLYTKYAKYKLNIFAFDEVSAYSNDIYNINQYIESKNNEKLIKYCTNNAIQYKDIQVKNGDKIIVLSTCYSAGNTSRAILVARLEKVEYQTNSEDMNKEENNIEFINKTNKNTISKKKIIICIVILFFILVIIWICVIGNGKSGKNGKTNL